MNKTKVSIIITIKNKPWHDGYSLFKCFPTIIPRYDGFYPLENSSYMFESSGTASFVQKAGDGLIARVGYTGKDWGQEAADKVVELLKADGWNLDVYVRAV